MLSWKIGTLRSLVQRAFIISSTTASRKKEIDHIYKVFTTINGYPSNAVNRIINDVKRNNQTYAVQNNDIHDTTVEINPTLVLPYKGNNGENLVRKYKNTLKNHLPPNVKPRIVYKSTKLSSMFNLKDKTNFHHKHDVVYLYKCPVTECGASYVGETSRRISERILDHQKRDKNSHILHHSVSSNHPVAAKNNFKIIGEMFGGYQKRKIAEAICIKDIKPNLNVQGQSFTLKLFD